jgi:hypothetical protein
MNQGEHTIVAEVTAIVDIADPQAHIGREDKTRW